jgi:endonuclease/exonuclease/phosphatase family metal-dependent hydrolase
MQVERQLAWAIDSIYAVSPNANILIAGDFNDYFDSPVLDSLYMHRLYNVSSHAVGCQGAKGTYRYHGEWGSLDQVLCSKPLADNLKDCYIGDLPFLLEDDEKYGGVRHKRCYLGPRYLNGYSDHLPLVARFFLIK